ncbi:MAG TPA: TonB-dependent receptor [Flavobacterium sp.]|nr:TonB-dependent receptor [Flavobacterium sp.]
MKTVFHFLTFFLVFTGFSAFAQQARIKGVVVDETNLPVAGVTVKVGEQTTTSDENGAYFLTVPANEKVTVVFSHVGHKNVSVFVTLKPNEDYLLNPQISTTTEMMGEVVVDNRNRPRVEGVVTVDPATIANSPGGNAGIENVLKTMPGVSGNNELSTGYNVRGGNFDENLVYVNEIEVYRPFLIRSGQQEGLSFTNTDMVSKVEFSAGGFQAKYGDKLSSVLDITYRRPYKFGAAATASFLGASAMVETASKNQKWDGIVGVRYRNNAMLVKSQETETNFRPIFADVQAAINWHPSLKWEWSFLGNISQNRYDYRPITRQTNFGTIDEPIALLIFYEGQERDKYLTYFGAVKSTYTVNDNFTLKFITSAYHTQEQEHYDILAQYRLGEVNSNLGDENFGNVEFTEGIGSQLNHARNDLDALIVNAEVKGNHRVGNDHQLDWGVKFTREDFRDRLVEWEVIDSAGFAINPPRIDLPRNDQPYNPYTGPLVPYQNVRATNFVTIDRFSGFAQWSKRASIGKGDLFINMGARFHSWKVSGDAVDGKQQTVFSPRAQFTFKPNGSRDMLFRLSGGFYHQPPFYRELRDATGTVNPDVKAQQSIHVVFGHDYAFKMWGDKKFRLVSEVYYKSLSDVNTYTIDNVRIRYSADNNAKAYVQGLDMRLNGEFVKGTESWFSFGYMKTEENYANKGWISRPTDQRLKFGILFQDYMPNIPNVKVYLNLVYNTGLPGGSPAYADPYQYQIRLPDYRRADVGFSYVFTENNDKRPDGHWLKKFRDFSAGFEIFNLFNNQNSITNTWVRDVYTKTQYGVPNYLTTRVFNLRFSMKL